MPKNNPIKESEVRKSIHCLKANRSTGPDNIPNDLTKYAGEAFIMYANVINKALETGQSIKT